MWPKNYKDYPPDARLIKEKVESGKGIVGCEMHDLNGWGERYHIPKEKKEGLLFRFWRWLLPGSKKGAP